MYADLQEQCSDVAWELDSLADVDVQLNTTLVSLELNSNSIDYDGATALAEAISENNSLTSLYLRCIPPLLTPACCLVDPVCVALLAATSMHSLLQQRCTRCARLSTAAVLHRVW